jgi:hypothetical protein
MAGLGLHTRHFFLTCTPENREKCCAQCDWFSGWRKTLKVFSSRRGEFVGHIVSRSYSQECSNHTADSKGSTHCHKILVPLMAGSVVSSSNAVSCKKLYQEYAKV